MEVNGVECQLSVKAHHEKGVSPKARTNHDRIRKRRRSASRRVNSEGQDSDDEDADPTLPSAADLAQSFLQTEPDPAEKAELEAAILAQTSEYGTESVTSEDEEYPVGTGAPLSLPAFMTGFLQGIVDRLQVRISSVTLNLNVEIPKESISLPSSQSLDLITVQLRVDKIDIEGVTQALEKGSGPDNERTVPRKEGKRLISLSHICGTLISDASFFSSLARSTAMSSPTAPRSDIFQDGSATSRASSSHGGGMEGFHGHSSEPASSPSTSKILSKSNEMGSIASSVVASSHGRFDDASDDEAHSEMSESAHRDSEMGSSSVFHNSAYLDQLSDSRYLNDEDEEEEEDEESVPPPGPSVLALQRNDRFKSPQLTPRASMHMAPSSPRSEDNDVKSSFNRDQERSKLRSSFVAGRTRFSANRISQSQISLPVDADSIAQEDSSPENSTKLATGSDSENSDGEDETATPMGENDLTESKYFSHEDAESMYMSAISQRSSAAVPGGWSSSSESDPRSAPGSPVSPRLKEQSRDNLEHALHASPLQSVAGSVAGLPTAASTSSLTSVRASRRLSFSSQIDVPPQTPPPIPQTSSDASERSSASSDDFTKLSKQLFHLDNINIYLSTDASVVPVQPVEEDSSSKSMFDSTFDDQSSMSQSISVDVPGAFSTHLPPSRKQPTKLPRQEHQPAPISNEEPQKSNGPIEVLLGNLQAQFDISIGRLLYKLISHLSEALKQDTKPTPPTVTESQDSSNSDLNVAVHAEQISVKFLERLEGRLGSSRNIGDPTPWVAPPAADVLLRVLLNGLNIDTSVSKSLTKTAVTLKKFIFGYSHDSILSFDAGLQMRSSVRDLKASDGIDISAVITQTSEATRCEVVTLPLHVSIDLQKLDETFSWFGGLSSVLNMGSSIASNATIMASPSKPKPRGVRFDTPIKPEDKSLLGQNKADVRIGGFVLDLVGSECSIGLETSAVKLVHRDEGVGVSIQKIRLSGPHLKRSNDEPAINVEVTATRVEYLPAPKDVDIDRMLDIITPSKSKFDQADDILLDTLVRQRKQGPVLRLTVENVQARIAKLDEFSYLPELGEEVAKLATVAKYLPEADRPGMLALVIVHKFGADVNVNNALGSIQLSSTGIEIAQITLPVLVALSVKTVSAKRNNSEDLFGPATSADMRETQARAPALMARMIGDELEPTIKIKLWNLKIEYRVPTLMTILGLTENSSTQDVSASLTASVATLTDFTRTKASQVLSQTQSPIETSASPSKPLKVDVTVKDCVLGLNPMGLPSKMLVVLTEAHLTAALPKDKNMNASIEGKKASLLIIDNVANILSGDSIPRNRGHSFDGGSSQVADLCATGYVSVSFISSARALVQMTTSQDGERSLDVELRDDLFVLESCADSTQTLVGILGALAPPSIPSKETKYRTKVIPVHDLLASLSGDAFGRAEGDYNFDDDFGLGAAGSDVGEILSEGGLDDLDFDSHYYEDSNDPYEGAISEDMGASLHSAGLTATDTQDGVLLESILESRDDPGDNEPLDFQEDHFGTGSILEGTAHRWNSSKNTYDKSNVKKVRKSPLKVCVRDVHIIWNLFDGYDWQNTRDIITKAVQDVESKAIEKRARNERRPTFDQDLDDDETEIGDFLFNSIYIGIPANRDPRELAAAINQELNDNATETESIADTAFSASPSRQGGSHRSRSKRLRLNRSKHHKITFELKGVAVDLVAFPPGSGETQSSIDIRVHDLEVYDHIPTSTWKLFATYMQEAGERETGSSMIHIEILNVRPIPDLAAAEIVLKATVLPLRLHVDQDALDFITRFFEFKDDSAPVNHSPGEVPFLQRAEVNSVVVKLDFKPKRVDYAGLRSGHTTEFMNFLILEEADMTLRHTIIYGVSGFDKLGKCLNDIWMPDIKRNQLPGILAGLAPVRSLVNVGGGLQQLVVVPLREYKKDGRIVRSISKGATAFAKTTGTELVKLGAKVAIGVQTVLQGAEGFLGPTVDSGPFSDDDSEEEKKKISLYANQPVGVMQGLRGGYAGLQRDLVLARDAIIAVPGEVMEGGNAAGVLRAVRKHAPTVILRPAIGVAKAGGQILMGATNSLDPANLQRADAVSSHLPLTDCIRKCILTKSRNIRSIELFMNNDRYIGIASVSLFLLINFDLCLFLLLCFSVHFVSA